MSKDLLFGIERHLFLFSIGSSIIYSASLLESRVFVAEWNWNRYPDYLDNRGDLRYDFSIRSMVPIPRKLVFLR